MKDFDKWNNLKKKIDGGNKKRFAHPREIWWFSSGLNVGMEIDGKNNLYERPGIVLKSHNKNTVTIIPISSNKEEKYYSFNFNYNSQVQSAILSQAKMIDIKRLTRKIGSLDEENFIKLNQKFIKYYKYESPISGAISEAEAINTNNISNSQNKSNEKFRIFKLSQQTVFLNEEYQVLALKKTRENTWLLPGGRVDDGELNLENALKREIKEELSLEDFDILQPIGIDQSNGKSTLAVAYLCKSKSLHKITLSPEHEEYKWLNKNDLEKYLYYKNIAREIIKYIEKISK